MNVLRSFELTVACAGERLDRFLVDQIEGLSRSHAQQLIESGHVEVLRAGNAALSRRALRPGYRVQAGEVVRADVPPALPSTLEPEAIPFDVIYEDKEMLVLDKPAGIAVHPAPGHERGTLVHALLARYPDLPGINGIQRPGIVHRLDLNTSGLLMVAKTERAQRSLSSQLAEHRVRKGYLALLSGSLQPSQGVIEAPIGRDPSHRQRMAVAHGGRPSRTRYFTLGALAGRSLVLAMPESGRMHQLRVHFAAAGHPLEGDRLYGGSMNLLQRQFLHAHRLRFARPSDGLMIECEAGLPPDLMQALLSLTRSGEEAGEAPPPETAVAAMLTLSCRLFRSAADASLAQGGF